MRTKFPAKRKYLRLSLLQEKNFKPGTKIVLFVCFRVELEYIS